MSTAFLMEALEDKRHLPQKALPADGTSLELRLGTTRTYWPPT